MDRDAGTTAPTFGEPGWSPSLTPHSGIGVDPDMVMPELVDAGARAKLAERFRSVCTEIRTSTPDARLARDSPLLPLKGDTAANKQFLASLGEFCAFGNFDLSGVDARGGCNSRLKLEPHHLTFMRNMLAVYDRPIRRISVQCAETAGDLSIEGVTATVLRFGRLHARSLTIVSSHIDGALQVDDKSDIKQGLVIYAVRGEPEIRVLDSTIGLREKTNSAVAIGRTLTRFVELSNVTVNGPLRFVDLATKTSLTLNGGTVTGDFDAVGAKIGGLFLMRGVTIEGQARLQAVAADRLGIEGKVFKKSVFLNEARIEKNLWIDAETRISEALELRNLHADAIRLTGLTVGASLIANSLKARSVTIEGATIASPDCKPCGVGLGNAEVSHFTLKGGEVKGSALAGNGRFRTFVVEGTVLEGLDCSDCHVDQYMLLAPRVSGYVNLAGAAVTQTLALSEGSARPNWGDGARLDLSELRADAIAVDACDLVKESQFHKCTDSKERAGTLLSFVPTTLTGARYRSIVPGRESLPAGYQAGTAAAGERQAKHQATALFRLEPEQLIHLVRSAQLARHDPQPYEELAEALTRAGETRKATELRVAKIENRLAQSDTGWVEWGWYQIYGMVSRYGFENSRAALLFMSLLALGMGIHLWGTKQQYLCFLRPGRYWTLSSFLVYSLWFSVDRAIPPLHLDPRMHEEAKLPWLVQNYFYLHRLCGTMLISIFAAGWAGVGH